MKRRRLFRAERIGQNAAVISAHLTDRDYLIGDRFTVADAYLTWSLLLFGRCGVDLAQWPPLAAYLARMQARPHIKAAIDIEMELRKTVKM